MNFSRRNGNLTFERAGRPVSYLASSRDHAMGDHATGLIPPQPRYDRLPKSVRISDCPGTMIRRVLDG